MKVLVIIPAYNEEENICRLISEIKDYDNNFDFLIINDCSTDATKKCLRNHDVKWLDLPVNLGIGGAVQTGYKYAQEHEYDIAIQMDGDGQHPPKYLKNLITPIVEGNADAVVGSRFLKGEGFQSSFMRRFGIKFLSGLIHIVAKVHILDVTSGFRAVNKKGIALFAAEYAQDYPEPEALVVSSLNGIKTVEIPVKMRERNGGVSSINGFKNIYYMIKVSIAILMAALSNKRK